MAKITVLKNKLRSGKPEYDAQLAGLADDALRLGEQPIMQGDNMIYTVQDSELSLAEVQGITALGGLVENYPIFAEMTATAYAKDVPVGIPNRSTTDQDGNVTILKWNQWGGPAHTDLTNGKKGVPLSTGTRYLTSDEWQIVGALTGVTLLDAEVYKALLPVPDEE